MERWPSHGTRHAALLLWVCLLALLALHLSLDLKGDSGIHSIRTLGHARSSATDTGPGNKGAPGAGAGSSSGAPGSGSSSARAAAASGGKAAAVAVAPLVLAKGARAAAAVAAAEPGPGSGPGSGSGLGLGLDPEVERALQQLGAQVTDWDSYSPVLASSGSSGASCRSSSGSSGSSSSSSGSSSSRGGDSSGSGLVQSARVGYYTRHTGTLWDWMAVAGALRLQWERRNPAWWYGKYGMSAATAAAIWEGTGSRTVCPPQYDVLVYCDTVVDARPVLERLVAAGGAVGGASGSGSGGGGGCDKPIVLQVTNRYDWKVRDAAAYLALMRAAAANRHVWWVTNSPFEQLYMSWQGLELPPERHLMLRPVGAAVLPPPPPLTTSHSSPGSRSGFGSGSGGLDRSSTFAVVVKGNRAKHPDRDVLLPQLRKMGLLPSHGGSSSSRRSSGTAGGGSSGTAEGQQQQQQQQQHVVHVYDRQYGGPAALAQHRGVVHLPYQMSIMGMYELLAAGGVYLLPSPDLFRQLRQKHRFGTAFVPLLSRSAVRRRDGSRLNWTHYVEWYHPDFEQAMVYWDSWEALQRLMRLPPSDPMWEAKRAAARAAMARVRGASLAGWGQVLGQAAEAACGGGPP
ncbi:hypothetical protein CHLRE_13g591000v5 [Chlamydomonas reinhardtii]|uniref:Uncharacterized protein n=1 Tax=Chlamydomonas reinhardtii TaxID=3055 RepID=A0A2K3D130_CHLRE|nr:uncharacterized protein CHLRE_13g591000v5 [Chlamydomonas reinhardtii]PNW74245.1 hypothetical protein CHLRE_13g591000v5 [Chlamydomonas reinhardtii]